MAEERRSGPRASAVGVGVVYESAAGERVEAEGLNIGEGGLFVCTPRPLAVGKRIALEVRFARESDSCSALGRVVWTRDAAIGEGLPAGMGIKLIDVEDDLSKSIVQLVQAESAMQSSKPAVKAPSREPTYVGLGALGAASSGSPVVSVSPGRENTLLGVGAPGPTDNPTPAVQHPSLATPPTVMREPSVTQEPSVVIDLVADAAKSPRAEVRSTPPLQAPTVARRRSGPLAFALIVLALAALAAYAIFDGGLERMLHPRAVPLAPAAAPAPVPAPVPPPSSVTKATASAPLPTAPMPSMPAVYATGPRPSSTPSAAAAASKPSAVPSETRKAPAASVVAPPVWHPKKPAVEDNPY